MEDYTQVNFSLTKDSIDELLLKYTQESIFKIVFKEFPDCDKKYLSPFRPDNHPNCFFEWYKGRLLFRDFADKRRDCVHAVKDYFKISNYIETFHFIDEYFESNPEIKQVSLNQHHHKYNTEFHDITTISRRFEMRDILFWKLFYITEEQLTEDSVYPILRFRFWGKKIQKWVSLAPLDITYAFAEFDKAIKIYRPYAKADNKFITNCKGDDIGNIKNIDESCNYLLITKSYKDCRVIRNEGYLNSVWFLSERVIPSSQMLLRLIEPHPVIIIFYDNDKTGIEGTEALKSKILEIAPEKTVLTIFSPLSYCKDPAAIVSIKGKSYLRNMLWETYPI